MRFDFRIFRDNDSQVHLYCYMNRFGTVIDYARNLSPYGNGTAHIIVLRNSFYAHKSNHPFYLLYYKSKIKSAIDVKINEHIGMTLFTSLVLF